MSGRQERLELAAVLRACFGREELLAEWAGDPGVDLPEPTTCGDGGRPMTSHLCAGRDLRGACDTVQRRLRCAIRA